MGKGSNVGSVSLRALALATMVCGWHAPAMAQTAPAADPSRSPQAADAVPEDADIVVTGSLIKGTPENSALPVDVISQQEIAKQGTPSVLELIKALPVSSGVIGESNQFQGGRGAGADGQSSINLRGFGPERTLVLLNGRRLAPTSDSFVDTNSIPQAAIGRIEVLKDGAASTYGSDAVAGVVNFITREDLKGFEAAANYRLISGSKGDVSGSLSWGWKNDRTQVLLSGYYKHRSPLAYSKRDWALRPYSENPQGGWTGGANPGRFIPLSGYTALTPTLIDPGCDTLGEVRAGPSATVPGGFSACRGQYTIWDNIVEEQNTYQGYAQIKTQLSDTVSFRLDALYSQVDVPHANRTPSFVPVRDVPATALPAGITGLDNSRTPATLGAYYVPGNNPGFIAFKAANPTLVPAASDGAFIPLGTWRPFLAGGNPLFGYDAASTHFNREQIRVSGEFDGRLPDSFIGHDVRWNIGLTYSRYQSKTVIRDTVNVRLALALRGLGGPNCDYRTGQPGIGACSWFYPFSNSIPSAPRSGITNPSFNPAVENKNLALIDWMFPKGDFTLTNQLIEWDAGLTGTSGIKLPGGAVQWAVGGQIRQNRFRSEYSVFNNTQLSPCADTPLNGNGVCFPRPSSPLVYEAYSTPVSLAQTVFALFGELSLPITNSINASVSARYEDYGSDGGSTFNPQVRAKWQILDFLALRGSYGTTFRAPPQVSLAPTSAVDGQNVFGTFVPVEVRGNPNLRPEKSTSYNLGAIFSSGGLKVSVDYWNYRFKGLLTSEPLNNVLSAAFGNGGPCVGDPAFIAAHFGFSSGCDSSTITRVSTTQINGPDIKTSGIDVMADYTIRNVLGGQVNVGGTATWIERYRVGALVVGGVADPTTAFDAVGKANIGTIAYPLPRWKAQGYAEFSTGPHTLRLTARFTGSYRDDRAGLFGYTPSFQTGTLAECGGGGSTTPTIVSERCGTVTRGQRIKAIILNDISYTLELPSEITLNATVTNAFDRDPPFARTELNYDPLTGDPLGRTVKISVRKRF